MIGKDLSGVYLGLQKVDIRPVPYSIDEMVAKYIHLKMREKNGLHKSERL